VPSSGEQSDLKSDLISPPISAQNVLTQSIRPLFSSVSSFFRRVPRLRSSACTSRRSSSRCDGSSLHMVPGSPPYALGVRKITARYPKCSLQFYDWRAL